MNTKSSIFTSNEAPRGNTLLVFMSKIKIDLTLKYPNFLFFFYTFKIAIKSVYFIPSSVFNAYLTQIKVILSAVKKYRIFPLVTNTIYIISLQQTEAVSTI